MTEETRNWKGALDALLGLRDKVSRSVQDEAARTLLTEDLVKDVLRVAWRNQFEDQRSEFRSKVKEIVTDTIEAYKIDRSKDETP